MARDRAGARGAHRRSGRDRALGPDARARHARRVRPAGPARDPVERPAHGGRVRGDRGAGRVRPAGRADGQPRADRVHGAQAAVAAQARAGQLRARGARDAPQGLRPAEADRRAGDRRRRRLRHAAAGRRAAAVERRGARRAGDRAVLAAAGARVARGVRPDARRRRGGRGRRRPGRRRARRGRGSARTAFSRDGHVRRRVRGAAGVPGGPAGARPCVLPRRAGRVAPDGRDALRGRLAGVAARRGRRRVPVR